MRFWVTRRVRKVVLFAGLPAILNASIGIACAQSAPAVGVEPSSCLSLVEPASPSAGPVAPVRDGGTSSGRIDRLRTLVMGTSSRTLSVQLGGAEALTTTPRTLHASARASSEPHFSQVRVVTSKLPTTSTAFETFGSSQVRLTTSSASAGISPSLRDEGFGGPLGGAISLTPSSVSNASASMTTLRTTFSPDATAGEMKPATTVSGSLSSGVPSSAPAARSLRPFATRALLPSGGSAFEQ
jgi:hypothetical protein